MQTYKETLKEIFETNCNFSETVNLQILQKILDEFSVSTAYDFGVSTQWISKSDHVLSSYDLT